MKQFLEKLKKKENLSFNESKLVFNTLMNGEASEDEIFSFLTLLSIKGEASDEIAGGVYVLREKSKRVNVQNCVDTCGTGGDGMNTLNISTASALLLSSMGIKVAKHGNKAVSSKCGSGDVLEALNIRIDLEPKDIEDQINKNNFGFMFAPNYHNAMRFVGPTRKKIGKRTIFNMIGPLSSPALVERQVVGVFEKKLLKIFANGLKNLKIKFAWIVNSDDGLDEISPYAKTNVVQIQDGKISEIIIDPISMKVNAENFNNLLGDDSIYNAARLLQIVGRDDPPEKGGPKFSKRFDFMPEYPSTDEGKIPLEGDREDVMTSVRKAFSDTIFSSVDGIRVTYEGGWFLCRPSNTEPILVMRVEGRDNETVDKILSDVKSRIGHLADIELLG